VSITAVRKPKDLDALKTKYQSEQKAVEKRVSVCIGTGCAAKGSRKIYELFQQASRESQANVAIEAKCVGCHGFC